jgi:putative nucleotidyltransferase with HDIG domain
MSTPSTTAAMRPDCSLYRTRFRTIPDLPTTSSSARRTYSPDATRRAILDSALALFEANGFHATSVQSVADEADVTKGAFYHHFGSKDELVHIIDAELLDHMLREQDRILASVDGPAEQLRAVIRLLVHSAVRFRSHVAVYQQERRYLEHARFDAVRRKRDRLLDALDCPGGDRTELVRAIESDVGLTLAVLRTANGSAAKAAGVGEAVAALSSNELGALARDIEPFDFFSQDPLGSRADRYRRHALATQRLAEQVRRTAGIAGGDELAVTALLHDVGRVVLPLPRQHYDFLTQAPGTPEQRLALERRRLAVDHATVGGLLLRRLGLPDRVASVVERHHAPDATDDAAVVRLADMLAHYLAGRPVGQRALIESARPLNLRWCDLTTLLARVPECLEARVVHAGPIPLSPRQREIVRGLARGRTYKQIGGELGVSDSTIRTHLHQLYKKLGVVDRAQAVLLATERGWL